MQSVNWDADFEAAVARFEEQALERSALHPFDRELYIANLREQLTSFYQDLERGYEILVRTVLDLSYSGVRLDGMEPISKKSMKAISHLFPSTEAVEKITSEEVAGKWLEEGTPLFQVLGLTPQAVSVLYETACYLLKEKQDADARAAFRLLLVLAPHMADFWTGYGVAQIRLARIDDAITSLERAVSLDPQGTQPLLLLCRALAEANRKGEAEARLNAKIDEAARRSERDTYELLEAARYELARFIPIL